MSIVRTGSELRLRFNHRGGADGSRQLSGVVVEDRVPGGVLVHATVDQPSALPKRDETQSQTALYVFEHAPRPLVTSVGGPTFYKAIRTLSVVGNETFVAQVEPAWAAFSTAVQGALVVKGRVEHAFTVDRDLNATVPGSGHIPGGELVRVRWRGTAVAAEVIESQAASLTEFSGTLDNPDDIAPGSVVITAVIGGTNMTIRDTGNGRLVGQEDPANGSERADGTINYLTGEWELTFSTAPDNPSDITADYEHSTLYIPLDISLNWDAQLAMG